MVRLLAGDSTITSDFCVSIILMNISKGSQIVKSTKGCYNNLLKKGTMEYEKIFPEILAEIDLVLSKVKSIEVERIVTEILKAEKVFIFGVGRVFLSLQSFGKRLGHLQIDCQVVGSINEKPILKKDLLLIASGSGESKLPIQIARIGKNKGATIGLITSSTRSTLKELAGFCIHLPSPTKKDKSAGVKSIQPMSTLFDQALHIFGDTVAKIIQERKGLKNEEIWKYHANLE